MNYLAHMVVGKWAGLEAAGVLGNFIGDAVKGRHVEAHWPADVAHGIRLHRELDEASDRHEASRQARALLRPWCGKWSGVVWDVLADHVLAREFTVLAEGCGPLDVFSRRHENVLRLQQEAMPERSRRFFQAMVAHGWLAGYRHGDVVDAVLQAMSQRRPSAGPVAQGWAAFEASSEPLAACARALVADMKIWATSVNAGFELTEKDVSLGEQLTR